MIRVILRVALLFTLIGNQGLAQQAAIPLEQLQAAAQSGQMNAQTQLGLRHLRGDGVPQDFALAAEWFAASAAQGDANAQNLLARLYSDGLGVAQDDATAIAFFEQAAVSGNPQYLSDLARVLERDDNTLPRAVALYERAAQSGDKTALVSLGTLYQSGRGVTQDFEKARDLYTKAASLGSGRALNNLGLIYARGEGIEQDYPRAAGLFAQAGEMGIKEAYRNLGVLHENGFGVPLDEAKAAALYKLASNADPSEPTSVARYVYDPRLTPIQSTSEALENIQAAAKAGDPVAQFQIGWVLLQKTEPTHAEIQQAAQWFTRAAQSGYGPAMANLGMMHFRGEGVLQDFVYGHMWMSLATTAGVILNEALIAEFVELPTPSQINESQALVRNRFKK
jgi:TPR repeat protein